MTNRPRRLRRRQDLSALCSIADQGQGRIDGGQATEQTRKSLGQATSPFARDALGGALEPSQASETAGTVHQASRTAETAHGRARCQLAAGGGDAILLPADRLIDQFG